MFGFLSPVRSDQIDPLTDADAALSFWQALPRNDLIAAQDAICKALAEPVERGVPSANRLQAILVLDQRARVLVDSLLANEGAANIPDKPNASASLQAAFVLCRSFGRAYGLLLRSIRDNGEFKDRRDLQALVLLRFFRERQLELLLRPFTDERAPAFSWKEIHDAYTLAQSLWLHCEPLPIKREQLRGAVETRLDREYVNVLMVDLMNGAQLPPYEASWVNRHLPRWCLAMALKRDEGPNGANRFVVHPGSDAGIVRTNGEAQENSLCLDMTPILKSIGAQLASLRDSTEPRDDGPARSRERQRKLLRKLSALCSVERPVVTRRGERLPMALNVEVAVGMPEILRRIRNKPDEVVAAPPPACSSEDVTISGFGSMTSGGAQTVTQSTTRAPLLTMVDQSDSGCRLQGAALIANPALPGSLIAFRDDAASPWSLAVVRRVKKRLAGRRVEIGAEYLGSGPAWVIIAISETDARPGKSVKREPQRFAGLYLRESREHPLLPMKTLVLPACGLSPGTKLTVRSRKSVHTICLKEPLEEQADFVWSPFEILDRWTQDEPAAGDALPRG